MIDSKSIPEPLAEGDVVVRGTSPTRMTIAEITKVEGLFMARCQWFLGGALCDSPFRLDELRRSRDEGVSRVVRRVYSDSQIECIAAVVHEANRAYCQTQDDWTQLAWNDAPQWQRDSARSGVRGILAGTITTPEESHISWMREKIETGWVYGPVKDSDAKQHPCMVPYAELPGAQRLKDHIFHAIVRAMGAFHDSEVDA